MPRMTFIMPDGTKREVEAPLGDTLLAIAQRNGISQLEGACEGVMACSTCHVVVDGDFYPMMPEPVEEEDDMLDFAYGLSLTSRLGCQVVMTVDLDGLVVRVPAETNNVLRGLMSVSPGFRDFVLDQLEAVPHDQRRMFGGIGLFSDGVMFGIITRSDALYLKTDETTVQNYEALGATPFTYTRDGVTRTMGGYFEVPADLLDSADQLAEWAQQAIEVSHRVAAAKGKRSAAPRRRGTSKRKRTR